MGFGRQIWTLTVKNLRISVQRHWLSTFVRAILAPIIFMFLIAYMKNFFIPPSNFGVGSPTQVRGFINALGASKGGRDTVAFVRNGFRGGQIEEVIQQISISVRTAGKTSVVLDSEAELLNVCRNSLRGASGCYGAAVFYSSPTEGNTRIWNYTIRSDGALGTNIYVNRDDNDQEIYLLPFQRAIDQAILANTGDGSTTLPTIFELPYTDKTPAQREATIRRLYMNAVIRFLGIAYILGIIGIVYHLVGRMAYERELGMSQLIEAMVPNKRRWQSQAVRLISLHLSFDIIWLPSWLVLGVILKALVFTQSSYGIVIIWQLLSGLALSSWSIMGGSLFHRAQLSGIVVIIVSLILAIAVQVQTPRSSIAVAILGLLFTPINYIFTIIYLGRFEQRGQPTNLLNNAPAGDGRSSNWRLSGIALWIFLIVQIFVYPIIGALIERARYGTTSKARKVEYGSSSQSENAIYLRALSKDYVPGFWARKIASKFGGDKRSTVHAVKMLDLTVLRGQILCLLGANGSGKSTTLDAIAGLNKVSSGEILIESAAGIGYCPQKNVLWDELTVYEHVSIFSGLKSVGQRDDKAQIEELIRACDLGRKMHAKSKTLSGGQKRKLQLAIMFIGGSDICCIDEVSSGLDPLSRRKIWDILLRERGIRTLLLTTHFLDEADVLADHIALLSKGVLKAEGSAAELKHCFGGGYRVQVAHTDQNDARHALDNKGRSWRTVNARPGLLSTTFECVDAEDATNFIRELENKGFSDYAVHGPTIEDVFLQLSDEVAEGDPDSAAAVVRLDSKKSEHVGGKMGYMGPNSQALPSKGSGSEVLAEKPIIELTTGTGVTLPKQTWILFKKRLIVLKRNYIPHIIALFLPIVVGGLVTTYVTDFPGLGCSPEDQSSNPALETLASRYSPFIVAGPTSRINQTLVDTVRLGNSSRLLLVDTYDGFSTAINTRFGVIKPGGFYLGDNATMAYVANYGPALALQMQSLINQALTNQIIGAQYKEFAVPFAPGTGDTLQFMFYFGLVMCAYPGFFALYPTIERIRKVRALHYSNGIRAAPLWLAYTLFDFIFVLIISVIVIAIWASVTNIWYHIGYLFVVFFLYGLTSTLLCYVISLYTSSQLATFAWAVGYNAALFALYFIAYLSIQTYSPPYAVDHDITMTHFLFGVITPSGNLLRGLLLTLNEFSVLCRGEQVVSYPGGIKVYGGPILYLIVQAVILFIWLVWYDSAYNLTLLARFRRSPRLTTDAEISVPQINGQLKDVSTEVTSASSNPGLQVQHLTKSFGGLTAVDDITFDINSSECFALLGPNGAGKSTTISLIRGDLRPDHNGGDVIVDGINVTTHRAAARIKLGVCPQFDAMDTMTVAEHLRFYAQARGVAVPERNVEALIAAVNLTEYRDRIAHNLSGGNKRKLSLAIALVGNPAVILLDEPSSGMDAANKRFLWRVLLEVTKGRSMLITTHSMEEADKLADRAGIMATRMLALGTSDELRDRFGELWYVQIVLRGAPHVSQEHTEKVRGLFESQLEGLRVESRMWCGQFRFSVPIKTCGIARLFGLLQENKETLGLEYYSVSRATLDQVFLEVVTRNNVEEEGEGAPQRKAPRRQWWRRT